MNWNTITLSCVLLIGGSVVAQTPREKTFEIKQEIGTFVTRPDIQERTHLNDGFVRFLIDTIEKSSIIAEQPSGWDRLVDTFFYNIYSKVPLLGGLGSNHSKGLVLLHEHDAPKLHACLQELCQCVGLNKPLLFLDWDNSHCNAVADSFGSRHAFIVVTRKLLETLSDRGIKGALAHELAHIKHNHSPKIALVTFVFLIAGGVLFHDDVGGYIKNTFAGLSFLAALYVVLLLVTRMCEVQADATARHKFNAQDDFVFAMDELQQHACGRFEGYQKEIAMLYERLQALHGKSPWMANFLARVTKCYDSVTTFGYKNSLEGAGLDHPSTSQRLAAQ